MPLWTWLDVAVYFGVVSVYAIVVLPPLSVLFIVLRASWFVLIELPIKILLNFHAWGLDSRDPFHMHSSITEFVFIEMLNWSLTHFNPVTMGPLLVGELPARILYDFRRFRYGTEAIGDNVIVQEQDKGFWVRSSSRADQPYDLVIYFVPGNLLGYASAYVYAEFISLLLTSLQATGFKNPAAFVLDADYILLGYDGSLDKTFEVWEWLVEATPSSTRVGMGTSIGASFLLSAKPVTAKADALVLLSPLFKPRTLPYNAAHDLLSARAVQRISQMWLREGADVQMQWWNDIVPDNGIYIFCGSEELLRRDIENMASTLKAVSTTKLVHLDVEDVQIHAWPIVMAFLGRKGFDQMYGIDRVATRIANLVLMNTQCA